jgi:hypothetical protein
MTLIVVEKVARSVSVRARLSKAAVITNIAPEKTGRAEGRGGDEQHPGSAARVVDPD